MGQYGQLWLESATKVNTLEQEEIAYPPIWTNPHKIGVLVVALSVVSFTTMLGENYL